MSTVNLAGFLVYRLTHKRPVEYLLLNDSFEHQRHWYPPKGKKIGSEDDIQCALRETLDLTGLATTDLIPDDSFKAELQYVDGIQPKQVVYILSRLADPSRYNMIRTDGAGMKYQWCQLDQALEKVVFGSMQNILTQAEKYIESNRDEILPSMQQRGRRHNYNDGEDRNERSYNSRQRDTNGSPNGESSSSMWRSPNASSDAGEVEGRFREMSMSNDQRTYRTGGDRGMQGSTGYWRDRNAGGYRDSNDSGNTQQRKPQDNPLYKTKLCEKFERDGECPYGPKCVFAHGQEELRVREPAQVEERPRDAVSNAYPRTIQGNRQYNNTNPLYKTRLCQRFAEQGECPYGDKCQFAHGEAELRPNVGEEPYPSRRPRDDGRDQRGSAPGERYANGGFNRGNANRANLWRSGQSNDQQPLPKESHSRNAQWRPMSDSPEEPASGDSPQFSDDGSLDAFRYSSSAKSPKPSQDNDAEFAAPHAAPLIRPAPQIIPSQTTSQKSRGPAASSGLSVPVSQKKSQEVNPSSLKSESGDKPWIKVVEVTDKELEQMGSPLIDPSQGDASKSKHTSKIAELEARLTKDLVGFFHSETERTQQECLKEVTHTEIRNSLTKQQLLNVVIAALFSPCKAAGISDAINKRAKLLEKIMTKKQDQALMLNAWQRLFTEDEHAEAWRKKASEVLGGLYDVSLLDEDIFTEWFEGRNGDNCSEAIAAMKPFSHWLATAEEE